jgi:GH43 family beta-xylosidase
MSPSARRRRLRPALLERLERRALLAGLSAQYFDSVDFTDLKLTRTDATVDFNWAGGPDASMGSDFFSVRWRGQVQPQYSQEYTFYVSTDDGTRLWVDGRLLVDNWVNQGVTERSGKIALEAGKNYDIRVDYYDFDLAAQAHLSWSSASQPKQIVPTSRLFTSPSGLSATYFDNANFTGPTTTRTDSLVDFTWNAGPPAPGIAADTFSTRWTGYLQPQHSQTYTFYVAGDADSTTRLRIDGQLVVDSSSSQDGGVIKLEANKFYDVELEYAENTGAANVRLEWSSPTQAKQVIPAARLFAAAETAIPTRTPTYTNSVEDRDLPDPGIIFADGSYWMTHTMGGPNNGWPLYKSSDMINWTFQKHLLTTANKPAFMTDAFWAPEIHKINGRYVMTGTSWSSTYGRLVIALATSSRIDGPYAIQPNPIVADTANAPSVNVLDSHIFQDHDGRVYFLWKRDSNASTGTNGTIRIREMNASGTAFLPGSVESIILDNTVGGWERNLAEAPWMMRRGGFYYLFYSGGFIDTTYSLGVARGTSPTGPFTRSAANPILTHNATWAGPGHGGFALDRDGVVWHLYHARHADDPDYGRVQMLDRVLWSADGWPTFGNGETPSFTPQVGPRVHAASGAGVVNVNTNNGGADTFILRRAAAGDSSVLEVVQNSIVVHSRAFAEIQTITIDGGAANDTLIVDNSLASALAGGGVTFTGGAGTNTLHIIGSSDADDTLQHNAGGKVLLGTGALTYTNVHKLRYDSGNFAVNTNVNNTAVEIAGANLAFNATQILSQLDLLADAVATLATGGSRVLKATGLTIASTARLDLRDNDLVIDYTLSSAIGAWQGSQYNGIQGLIAKGRQPDLSWDGPGGIGTGMTQASVQQHTTLAAAEASYVLNLTAAQTSNWAGVSVDATSVIVKYTWTGDLNLDGLIDAQDYGVIDNWVQFPGSCDYFNGDVNYDGVIDAADYGYMDNNIQVQNGML